MLTAALFSTGRFVLLGRRSIDDVRQEIRVGQELGNDKTAVKRGGVPGAQALIRCAVTEFEPDASSRGGGIRLGPVTLGGRKGTAKVSVHVRLYDASSSRALHNATACGDSKSQAGGASLDLGSFGATFGGSKTEPIEVATRRAIEKGVEIIIQQTAKLPWEGRVAAVSAEGRITINRGSDNGLHEGDVL